VSQAKIRHRIPLSVFATISYGLSDFRLASPVVAIFADLQDGSHRSIFNRPMMRDWCDREGHG
jgi:hypothetical protein